jgi:predicted nuclease of predicted toxin-antitoxin system
MKILVDVNLPPAWVDALGAHVRTQDVLPEFLSELVVRALRDHEQALASGALVTVDAASSRVRVLPLK